MNSEKNAPPQASASTDPAGCRYRWFRMPDLNRATHRRLGQRSRSNPEGTGAGWTFETICRLIHHVGRVGRPKYRKAAKELGRLSVGLQAIADEAGISVAKVRRDLTKLVDLGLVTVSRRNVTFNVDPATGRIKENRTGRSLPVVVFLTVGPEHLRTKAGQDRPAAAPATASPSAPAKLEGATLHDRDHSGGAIQRHLNQREPDGHAAGVGRPQAGPGGSLAAAEAPGGEAGGHTAAKAGQERVVVRADAAEDDLPVPIGRISRPAGKAAAPRPSGRQPLPEDHEGPKPFVGQDHDRFAATRRRLDAERAAREAQDAAWRAAREAAELPPTRDPMERLQEAVEALPDASRDRADELGQEIDEKATAGRPRSPAPTSSETTASPSTCAAAN